MTTILTRQTSTLRDLLDSLSQDNQMVQIFKNFITSGAFWKNLMLEVVVDTTVLHVERKTEYIQT